MSVTRKPPRQSVDSFQDRKWKEQLVNSQAITVTIPNASFVTIGPNAGLENERTLAGSSNIAITDNGANSNVSIDLTNTGASAGSYVRPNLTIDSKGRITSATSTVANIPEYDADPSSPANGDVWVLRSTSGGGAGAGEAYGMLTAITNAGTGATKTYQLSYKTETGGTKRVSLT